MSVCFDITCVTISLVGRSYPFERGGGIGSGIQIPPLFDCEIPFGLSLHHPGGDTDMLRDFREESLQKEEDGGNGIGGDG